MVETLGEDAGEVAGKDADTDAGDDAEIIDLTGLDSPTPSPDVTFKVEESQET
jgi:hypothetical protein